MISDRLLYGRCIPNLSIISNVECQDVKYLFQTTGSYWVICHCEIFGVSWHKNITHSDNIINMIDTLPSCQLWGMLDYPAKIRSIFSRSDALQGFSSAFLDYKMLTDPSQSYSYQTFTYACICITGHVRSYQVCIHVYPIFLAKWGVIRFFTHVYPYFWPCEELSEFYTWHS